MKNLETRSLLIADDDPDIAFVREMNPRLAGFAVIIARDGEEALDLARAAQPDLVVLDI